MWMRGVALAMNVLLGCASAWVVPRTLPPPGGFRPHPSASLRGAPCRPLPLREVSAASRRGLAVSIFVLPPASMDAQSLMENALFTVTTAFALSRVLAIITAKIADALNPGVKMAEDQWNRLLDEGRLSQQV